MSVRMKHVYASRGVLVVPADLPLLSVDDVTTLLRRAVDPPVVVIAPDRHHRGTNALLLSPADLIQYDFGGNSFHRHCEQARNAGARLEIVELPSALWQVTHTCDAICCPRAASGFAGPLLWACAPAAAAIPASSTRKFRTIEVFIKAPSLLVCGSRVVRSDARFSLRAGLRSRVFYRTYLPGIFLPVSLVHLFHSARFVISVAEPAGLPPPSLPEIAFAGRSNAGKSTAINVLTQQKRLAFASKTPGRTQLLNFFELSERNGDGETVPRGFLVDLPGYGYAKAPQAQRSQWDALVGGYVAQRQSLVGIVIVMDARRPLMPGDEALIAFVDRPTCAGDGGAMAGCIVDARRNAETADEGCPMAVLA